MDQHARAVVPSSADATPEPSPGAGSLPVIFVIHPSDRLTDHLPIGDGLVANGFIRELLARGYRMHIAVRDMDMKTPLPPNATVYRLGPYKAGPLGSRLHVDSGWGERVIYMVRVRRLLARLRRTHRIDVAHQLNPVFTGLSLALVGTGIPVVLGPFVPRWPRGADDGLPGLKGVLAGWARNAVCFAQQSQAAALLIACEAAVNRIPLAGRARRKMAVVPHGLDVAAFQPRPTAVATSAAPPSILFYANVWWRKGVFVLLDAFRIVAEALPDCRLSIVGDGEGVAEVARRVHAYGLGGRVDLSGRVPRSEAPALFRAHSVYCLPSFGEPYGMTAIEAMSCGRPLVITNDGGLRFMVPEEGSLRVPPGDVQALAGALLTVLRSPELQARMGHANRRFVVETCSWPRVVDRLEQVYADAIRHPGI